MASRPFNIASQGIISGDNLNIAVQGFLGGEDGTVNSLINVVVQASASVLRTFGFSGLAEVVVQASHSRIFVDVHEILGEANVVVQAISSVVKSLGIDGSTDVVVNADSPSVSITKAFQSDVDTVVSASHVLETILGDQRAGKSGLTPRRSSTYRPAPHTYLHTQLPKWNADIHVHAASEMLFVPAPIEERKFKYSLADHITGIKIKTTGPKSLEDYLTKAKQRVQDTAKQTKVQPEKKIEELPQEPVSFSMDSTTSLAATVSSELEITDGWAMQLQDQIQKEDDLFAAQILSPSDIDVIGNTDQIELIDQEDKILARGLDLDRLINRVSGKDIRMGIKENRIKGLERQIQEEDDLISII